MSFDTKPNFLVLQFWLMKFSNDDTMLMLIAVVAVLVEAIITATQHVKNGKYFARTDLI